MKAGRLTKLETEITNELGINMNGFHNGCSNMNGLKPNINDISQNKADDNSMMQIILKPTLNDNKNNSGHHYGSNTNITSPLYGLPGVRGRTRVSTGGL